MEFLDIWKNLRVLYSLKVLCLFFCLLGVVVAAAAAAAAAACCCWTTSYDYSLKTPTPQPAVTSSGSSNS
jgi:hypothetical protein